MPKFKKGDEVFVVNSDLHKCRPEYYPAVGSYGTVRGVANDSITVQYGANSGTAYDHVWCIDDSALCKVTQKDRNRAVRYYTTYVFAPALSYNFGFNLREYIHKCGDGLCKTEREQVARRARN